LGGVTLIKHALLLLFVATPVLAQQPSEEVKKAALLRAYHLNGDKMCCGYIDLTEQPKAVKLQKITPTELPKIHCYELRGVTGQSYFDCPQPKK
jgi:hypothetical protein